MTNDNGLEYNIENKTKDEKVDGDSNYIKQKSFECDISSMNKNIDGDSIMMWQNCKRNMLKLRKIELSPREKMICNTTETIHRKFEENQIIRTEDICTLVHCILRGQGPWASEISWLSFSSDWSLALQFY